MRKYLRVVAAFCVLIGLSGCAGMPEIPYDSSTAKVQTIGFPSPAFPDDPQVVLASSVGQSFGLVGGLIDAAMQSKRDSDFEALMQAQHFAAKGQFIADLTEALKAKGFTVVPYQAARPKAEFLTSYPAAPQKVDAYLDVVVSGYGYLAAGIGQDTPYRPYVIMKCKLVRASDSSVLMQDSITLNAIFPAKQQITLSPNPAYAFATFDDLTAAPSEATAGVQSAMAQTSHTVGGLLQ